MALVPLVIADLTQATIEGAGVFDTLMRANKAHLEAEFTKNRIKGAEYATVYLGSLESVLRASVEFLLQKDKLSLEALLLEQQILLAKVGVEKAQAELKLLQQSLLKIPAEIALLTQQTSNLAAEALNIPKQGLVLDGQKCKLNAEFDLLTAEKLKSAAETTLLGQKQVTEKAQVMSIGVDADSVIGKQKALYTAQTEGFKRDAEQKAAKLMTDTWSVRRTTNEETLASDALNSLGDASIKRAVDKLLGGVGA